MRRVERGSPATFKGVIDTTFRDGQQSPLVAEQISRFTREQKFDLFDALHGYGVRTFEFFSPVVNDEEADDFKAIRARVDSMPPGDRPSLRAHVRCNEQDIKLALDAGADGLHLYMGVGEHTLKTGHGKSLPQVKDMVGGTLADLRSDKRYKDIYLRYSAEDAFNTSRRNLYTVFDAAAPYVNTLGIPDTTGIARDKSIRSLVRAMKRRYPGIALEGHNHDDYKESQHNSITEVEEGVEYISTSLWGLAERSGITSMTGLLFGLHHLNPEYTDKYVIGSSYILNTMMGDILQLPVPYNEPVSLTNRTHVAGVHTKSTQNYEQRALEQFGVTQDKLLLGPHCGWHNTRYFLRELKFLDVTDEQAKAITQKLKKGAGKLHGRKDAETKVMRSVKKYKVPHLSGHEQGTVVYERAGIRT